jgi:hypothetical protein
VIAFLRAVVRGTVTFSVRPSSNFYYYHYQSRGWDFYSIHVGRLSVMVSGL